MEGLAFEGQQDFSRGAFPLQERVPRAAVEDCVNGLYADDGSIFKRGGGAYKSTVDATDPLTGLWTPTLLGGPMIVGDRSVAGGITVLAADGASWLDLDPTAHYPVGRAAVQSGLLVMATAGGELFYYGGARKAGDLSNVTFTNGSKTATAAGENWLTTVDTGMFMEALGDPTPIVASVETDTSLTLRDAWTGSTGAIPLTGIAKTTTKIPPVPASFVEAIANRIVIAGGLRVYFTGIGEQFTFDPTNYHELPASVIGLAAAGDLIVFTVDGVYVIRNMAFNLTDDVGNVQQSLERINSELVLWHNNGIARVQGGVVVPATDNVHVLEASGRTTRIGDAVRKLYQGYVVAGYTLGLATIEHGHYLLPVLNAGVWVDTLVCRLSTGAWSRLAGHGGSPVAFAAQPAAGAARQPALFAARGKRVLDLTGIFAPAAGNKLEADGSTHTLQVTFRTVQRKTSGETLRKVRVRYELDDAAADNPTLTAAVAVGRPGSAFTALTGAAPENVGQTPKVWTKVNRTGSEFRLRLTSAGPSSSLVLRSVEYGFRPSGRQ